MSLRVRLPALVPDALVVEDVRALVRRFAESRDEAAFAAVVARHARMVYGVCRRAVRDAHLAEDAFQAVFLVLARSPLRAASASAVGGWLFGIARRVGLAARRREDRVARRHANAELRRKRDEQPDFDDLLRVLDEELAALPDEYRSPLVACFLEERTLDEAAKQLGWSVSTLRRRLDRAKELLRARLTRRGATLAGGLFAGFLAQSANAAVPTRLLETAVPSANATPLAAALAAEVGRGSLTVKVGLATVVVVLGLGGLALAFSPENREQTPPARQETPSARREIEIAPTPRAVKTKSVAVRGRIVFPAKRALPGVRIVPADTIKDNEFFGFQVYRDVLVDPETRGIANAVVWLRPDSDDKNATFPAAMYSPAKPVDHSIVATRDGFMPRVSAIRAGDRLAFTNPSSVVFNVRYQRPTADATPMDWETGAFNVILPPGRTHTTKAMPALRAADYFTDSIHPWVQGYVWAFDHPYFAVSDSNGNFEIKDAPSGAWRLVVWHEKIGYLGGAKGRFGERVVVDGREIKPVALESANWDEK
jgi:RNA polymerase sigma factor (sigma-70 family)